MITMKRALTLSTLAALLTLSTLAALILSATPVTADTPQGITYRVHVQNIGWMPPSISPHAAGTKGTGLRVEALELGGPITYRGHVQDIGWMPWVSPLATDGRSWIGTTGRSLRLEAIQITLDPTWEAGGSRLEYQCNVDGTWGPWVSGGATCGTTGQSKPLHAIRIRLTR